MLLVMITEFITELIKFGPIIHVSKFFLVAFYGIFAFWGLAYCYLP